MTAAPDLILIQRYGWTPSQVGALPTETRDLLLSLPPPLPAPSREGRLWRWLSAPRFSAAHLLALAACMGVLVWAGWPLGITLVVTLAGLCALAAVVSVIAADRRERAR